MSALVGSDLAPFPHESTQSLLLRLAHWNRMQTSDLVQLGVVPIQRSGAPVQLSEEGKEGLRELTGWRVDSREAWLFKHFRHTHMVVPGFRFCAVCLSGGYHSYFYQLACVGECPIHRAPLWQACPSCGASLGQADCGRCLLTHAYYCIRCSRPLGLQAPTAATYLALRATASKIRSALLPHWLWTKRVVATRRALPTLFLQDFGRPVRPELAACQASVICAVVPGDCIRPTIPLTVLSWRLQGRPGETVKRHRVRLALVYRATLRNLQRWILAMMPQADPNLPTSQFPMQAVEIAAAGPIPVTRERAARAYQLLRYAVERVRDDLPIHHDLDAAMPAWDFNVVERSLRDFPRLPMRAVFLAMFAESYLRSQGRSDFSPATEGVRTDAELVLCSGISTGIRWGFLCFPGLAGLPTRPFQRVEAAVSAALLSLAQPEPPIRSQRVADENDRR